MMPNAEAVYNTHKLDASERTDSDQRTIESVGNTDQTQPTRTLQRTIGNAQLCRSLRMAEPGSRGQPYLPPSVTRAIQQASGEALPTANRGHMESVFGADLGGVRIHQDSDSSHAADDIGARAFTVGQDVYFGAGQYEPGTERGDHLLAHELTHTLQQTGAITPRADTPISRPADPAEREAEAVVARIRDPGDQIRSSHQKPRLTTPSMVQGDWGDFFTDSGGGGDQAGAELPGSEVEPGAEPAQPQAGAAAESQSADSEPVAGMDTISRLMEAITDAGQFLPGDLMDQLKELLSPQALAIMAAFVVAQAFGAGEIADAAGLAMLAWKIGSDAVIVAEDLFDFFALAIGAQVKKDLKEAGRHLAHAVTLAGVDAVLVFLAAKESSEGKGKTGEGEGEGGGKGEGEGEGKGESEGKGEEPLASTELDGVMTDEDIHPEDAAEPEPVSEPELDPAICFPAGTPVATPSGLRPIEHLRPGDEVLSFDAELNAVVVAAIAETTRGRTRRWVRVDVGCTVLRATGSHRFWVSSKHDWCRADALVPGMTLLSRSGQMLEVRDVSAHLVGSGEKGGGWEATYNLSIPGTENYFVGDTGLLVHNITLSRFNWLSRAGYSNYVLSDSTGRIYYSGMFGPGVDPAQVRARHAANSNRFNPETDKMKMISGTREYGEARLMEQQLAEENGTVRLDKPDTYRCNRQNPMASDKVPEYKEYLEVKAGCA